jgi:hypothetical protein
VLEFALREALSLGHNYIGTEHILLGLVREYEGVAARILLDFDADAEKIRNEVIRMLSVRPPASRARALRAQTISRQSNYDCAELCRLHDSSRTACGSLASRSGITAWSCGGQRLTTAATEGRPYWLLLSDDVGTIYDGVAGHSGGSQHRGLPLRGRIRASSPTRSYLAASPSGVNGRRGLDLPHGLTAQGSFRNTGPGEGPLALVVPLAESVRDLRQSEGVAELDRDAVFGARPLDPCHGALAQVALLVGSHEGRGGEPRPRLPPNPAAGWAGERVRGGAVTRSRLIGRRRRHKTS